MGSILDQYPPLYGWKKKDSSLFFSLQKPPFLFEWRERVPRSEKLFASIVMTTISANLDTALFGILTLDK